jgi:protein-S-isoprenylcysteine O-methyltransferase Ste14
MDVLNSVGVLLGSSWASGLNLYLCAAGLGIAQRMHWISLPGDMTALAHPQVIAVAIVLFVIEFVADKIPYVDSVWDSIHTFIRPLASAALGFMATSDAGSLPQFLVALATGSITMGSHMAKATTRAAINTSPEPITNSVASVAEDLTVTGLLYLMIAHPVLASLVVIGLIVFSAWLLKKFYPFTKKIFGFFPSRKAMKP